MVLKYKCPVCGELHKNLERHINDNHKPKRFTCLICGFSTNIHYDKHLLEQHSMTVQNYYDKFYLKNNENLCKICSKKAKFNSLTKGYYETCGNKHCMAKVSQVKCIKTLKKKYNISDEVEITNISQFKEIQDIISKNNEEKYGVKNTFLIKDKDGIEKRIKTWQKNLNCDYPSQNKEVRKRIVEVCNEKYGCDNVMQNHNIRLINQSKISYNGINFDSQMEVDFYKLLEQNNIPFEYQPDVSFEYFDTKNKKHTYEPDFRIKNKLYEIKGLHFFLNGDKTQRMINPYGRKDGPEIVKYRDDIMEAKHQCMIIHNVTIITNLNEINLNELMENE